MENNKNKKSVKFQGDMLNFCDFIQVFVFTRNHHLNVRAYENIQTKQKRTHIVYADCLVIRNGRKIAGSTLLYSIIQN